MKNPVIKVDSDKSHTAIYLTLKKGKIARTLEVYDGINIDMDKDGTILGIEIIRITNAG